MQTKTRLLLLTLSLAVFGVSGYFGNFIFSHYLQRNVVKTTITYPILFCFIYLFIWLSGSQALAMIPLIILWGMLHTSGLIISQTWLMRDAKAAPEFANRFF
ncbi:MFS transporter [Proteus terrae]|uniref:MFS transporter n=1 Tax=Proteus terrae TaxID=1574161 RepID=UPI000B4E4190|nr:MFS transporter [Proteus terrae]PNL48709.1 MFS transporter [Proteus mirabilis]